MRFSKDDKACTGLDATRAAAWLGPFGVLLLATACGGSQATTQTPTDEVAQAAAPEDDQADDPEESWGQADSEETTAGPGESEPAQEGDTPETRTTEVLQQVVAGKRGAVRACYDKAREKNSGLPGGDFILRIVIDPEGAVTNVEHDVARSTVKSPEVAQCAIAEVKTWTFPPSSRGMETTMNYPFNFKP